MEAVSGDDPGLEQPAPEPVEVDDEGLGPRPHHEHEHERDGPEHHGQQPGVVRQRGAAPAGHPRVHGRHHIDDVGKEHEAGDLVTPCTSESV